MDSEACIGSGLPNHTPGYPLNQKHRNGRKELVTTEDLGKGHEEASGPIW